MPTIKEVFHDDCSVMDWEKESGRDLITNGSELYFELPTSYQDQEGSYYKDLFYGNPILWETGNTTVVKFKFNQVLTQNEITQTTEVRFTTGDSITHALNIFAITQGQPPSEAFPDNRRERYVGLISWQKAKDISSIPADLKCTVLIDEYAEYAEIKVVKVVDEGRNFFNVYVDDIFIKRMEISNVGNFDGIRLYSYQFWDIGSPTQEIFTKLDDINFEWTFIPVESFSFSSNSVTLIKGQFESIDMLINPEDAYYTSIDMYSEDETIATASIEAVEVGETNVISVLETVDSITGERIEFSDSVHVTVLTNILDAPNKPIWNNTVLCWDAVENANGYTIKVYVDSDEYTGQFNAVDTEAGFNSYDLDDTIANANKYFTNLFITATIMAKGDYAPYFPSVESATSDAYVFPALPQVSQPTWANKVLTWQDVANAESYSVRLYNASGGLLDTQTVNKGVQRYDYTDLIENYLPAGSYTATVQAMPEVI